MGNATIRIILVLYLLYEYKYKYNKFVYIELMIQLKKSCTICKWLVNMTTSLGQSDYRFTVRSPNTILIVWLI